MSENSIVIKNRAFVPPCANIIVTQRHKSKVWYPVLLILIINL